MVGLKFLEELVVHITAYWCLERSQSNLGGRRRILDTEERAKLSKFILGGGRAKGSKGREKPQSFWPAREIKTKESGASVSPLERSSRKLEGGSLESLSIYTPGFAPASCL